MKLVIRLHNQAGIVMMQGDRPDKNINVRFENLTPDALDGLGIIDDEQVFHFDEPMIVTGITIEGLND